MFAASTSTLPPVGLMARSPRDHFLVRLNSTGGVLYSDVFGGSEVEPSTRLLLDGKGNLFVVGTFRNTASFGRTTLPSKGGTDVFVWKRRAGDLD